MRVEGWELRLGGVFDQWRDAPFEWGTHDCVLFAARCVEAVTGENPCPGLEGTYTTQAGALAALSAAGYADLAEAFEAAVGAPRPVLFARRGDIVLTDPFVSAVVDLTGETIVGLDPVAGFTFAPLRSAISAFTVG